MSRPLYRLRLFRNYLPACSSASACAALGFRAASLLYRFTGDCKITARMLLLSESYKMLSHNNYKNKAENQNFYTLSPGY